MDLEYDFEDWGFMWKLIDGGWVDVVYGFCFYGNFYWVFYFYYYLGNKLIISLIDLVCNINFIDIEVCYKMFWWEVLEDLCLICNDFGFEVEFIMKVIRLLKWWWIYEVGVVYYGCIFVEGKKINWWDGVKVLGYIVKFWLINV